MNIKEIIATEILKSGWLSLQCKSLCKDKMLADDLIQEILLIVLEYKSEELLTSLYAKGRHLAFIRKIINNQYKSTTSPFWYKYRKDVGVEFDEEMLDGVKINRAYE